jgi:hypothetical protein
MDIVNSSRMDTSQILAVAFGGTTIAVLGGIAEYMKEKEMPRAKGVMRDFIIGAVLTLLLFQLLPDSMNDLSQVLTSFGSLPSLPSFSSGGGVDPELQVGIPKF